MENCKINADASYNDIRAKVQPSPNVYTLNTNYGERGNLLIANNNELSINLTNQARGVYNVLLRTENKVFSRKIILQ